MQLTSFTNHAMRTLIYVGLRPDCRCTTAEIAAAYGISENHLTKVIQALARQGWVRTTKGRGGGICLAVPPEEIGVGAAVRFAEGNMDLVECFDPATNTCPLQPACKLSRVLREARDAFLDVLDGYTLADLLHNPKALRPLLGLPATMPRPADAAA
jgi:Rrf2 family nitric oxide-sensitive transcriptional repressor